MSEITHCYICNSERVSLFKEANGFPIYKCKSCNLMWVAEGIGEDYIKSFYDHSYFNSENELGYQNYLHNEVNHRENAKRLIKRFEKIKELDNMSILDVGCAHGFLIDELRKLRNCRVCGIELNMHAYNYAKDKLNLNVLNCTLNNSGFEENSFDAVFLIGVIEHLIDPRSLLRDIKKVLKPAGLLIITTIDTKGLIPLYSFKPPEHLFYFNNTNFLDLIKQCGYKKKLIETNAYIFYLHDLFHRLRIFSSLSIFDFLSKQTFKLFPNLSVKIPTNEMLIICENSK